MEWSAERDVEILRIVSPDEFYVRFKSEALSYERLEDSLRQHYSRPNNLVVSNPKAEGFFMYVVSENYSFRRVVLTEEGLYLCDEGRLLEGSPELYAAPTFLKLIRPFAFKCHVDGSGSFPYTNEQIATFVQLLGESPNLVKIVASLPSNCMESSWYKSLPARVHILESFSSPVRSSVERRSSLQAQCLALQSMREIKDENIVSPPTTEIKSWKKALIPSYPGPHPARVTHIDCYGQVYLHLASRVESFRRVREAVNIEGKLLDFPGDDYIWKEGDVCLAKFEDGLFYRGIVLGVKGGIGAVLYVDYGNLMEVRLQELKIPISTGDAPMLSLRVLADNVAPLGGGLKWPRPVLEELYSLMYYANNNSVRFTMLPGHRGFPLPVLLEVLLDENWVSISEILIGSQNGKKDSLLTPEAYKIMNDYVGNTEGMYDLSLTDSSDEEDIVLQDDDLFQNMETVSLLEKLSM